MADLLSSASLLLAIVGVLYSLWYGDISSALAVILPAHTEDRQKPLSSVRVAFWSKAFPLVIASACVALVFLPPVLRIIVRSFNGYANQGWGYLATYDAIATSLVLVEVFVLVLFAHSVVRLVKLRIKLSSKGGGAS